MAGKGADSFMNRFAVLAMAVAFVGCSSDPPTNPGGGGGGGGGGGPAPDEVTVTMTETSFTPATTRVAVGGTVTWDNTSSAPHTVTPQGHTEWENHSLPEEATFDVTFDTADSYDYECTIHANMTGTINVEEPDDA
ncbi:MAG: hypothetical protein GEU90_16145 [Gemmatimonas sp.]|nr:hypothetical protein [Gemmatimonas sp.]